MTIENLKGINRQNFSDELDDLLWCGKCFYCAVLSIFFFFHFRFWFYFLLDPVDDIEGYTSDHPRGCNFGFGADVTRAFLERNNLSLLVRSHEYKMEGFEAQHDGRCVTVFSAPNYCGSIGNRGAVLVLGGEKGKVLDERTGLRVVQFGPKHYPLKKKKKIY